MEFLGIGYQELLLVLVLLLVVVGPERLPAMAYQIGRAVRQMQRYARAVRSEFSDEFDYLEEQYRTVKGEIDTTRSGLREQQSRFEAEMRDSTKELNEPLIPSETPSAAMRARLPKKAAGGAAETAATEAPEVPASAPAATEAKPEEPAERPPLLF